MKSIQKVFILIVVVLFPSMTIAQQIESRHWYVEKIEIKPKKIADFKDHLSNLVSVCAEENFPHSYSVCKDNDNIFYVFHVISGIAEIEELKASKKQTIENMRSGRAYKKCIQSTQDFVIKDLPQLNYIPVEPRLLWADVGFTTWEMHTVKEGQIEEYMNKLHDFQSIKDYLHYDDPSFVFEIAEGRNTPTFVLMSYGRDQQDRRHEDSRLWQVLGDEGRMRYEKLYPFMTDQKFLYLWKINQASYTVKVFEETL